MNENLALMDQTRLNFSPESLVIINLTLAFIMFGVALEIKPVHFKQIAQNPKSALLGFISQFFLLPLVTFLLIVVLRNFITPTIAMGMILVACCPGGNISNFISSLSKANIALSVCLTAIATLSAIILTPANFALWGSLYINHVADASSNMLLRTLQIDIVQMFYTVFILLGIPLLLGMLVNWKFPKFTLHIVKPIKILSVLIFIAIVIMAFIKNYDYFLQHIKYIFLIVLAHNGVAFLTGFSWGKLFKLKVPDVRTLTVETGIQNSALGLVLLFNPKIFPPELAVGGMTIIAGWWGIWHIISGLSLAGFLSTRKLKMN